MNENTKLRLHKPLIAGIDQALTEIFLNGKKSDQALPAVLKSNSRWGSRDRAFIAENVYEIVRNKRLIYHILDSSEPKIPQIIGVWLIIKGLYDETNEVFEDLNPEEILLRSTISDPKIKYSVPDELDTYLINELGAEVWYKELEAMSSPADVFLRVNLNRISKEELKSLLDKQGIETKGVSKVKSALRLLKRKNITTTQEFKNGFFEIQDAGSQLITEFLDVHTDNFVIDACAGAGGKSLHIADVLGKTGKIVAMDIEEYKLNELKVRAQRNKAKNISVELIDKGTVNRYKEKADRLLLDVPCSGLGVIKRNPDAKEALTPAFIENIKAVQQDILQQYSKMLKSGGYMVYATCSILPSENKDQVDVFLKNNTEYSLVKDQQILPSETGFDGFYMALIQKS